MGLLDLITGGRPRIISTPPFLPGGRPGMDYAPGNPGLLDLLSGGIDAAARPGTGSAGMDLMGGMSAGIGAGRQMQDANLKKRIAVMELSRKFENDAILAEARRADAERDKARAQLDLHNASKKPQTLQEKFAEAMKMPGMTPEKAQHWALTGKLPDEPKPEKATPTVRVTPGAAKAAGLAVTTSVKDVQVPTTDPLNDARTVPVSTEDPLDLPASASTPVINNWNRIQQQGAPGTARPMNPQTWYTNQGIKIWNGMNPDGTPNIVDTGLTNERTRGGRGGASGGGSRPPGGTFTRAKAVQIEQQKGRKFTDILKAIEKDEDIESNAERYLLEAMDAQQAYEDAIEAGTGQQIDAAKSLADLEAVKSSVIQRIQHKIQSDKVKVETPKGSRSKWDAGSWLKPPATAPATTSPATAAPKLVYDPVSRKLVNQ